MAGNLYFCRMNYAETPAAGSLRFPKRDRLRHRSLVEELFAEGRSLYEYPLRLQWRVVPRERLSEVFRQGLPPRFGKVQMMVTVPKKKRRHAVDRVLLRRRIREAYRLNRAGLMAEAVHLPEGSMLELAFIYLHSENADYAEIEKKMKILLGLLVKKQRKRREERREDRREERIEERSADDNGEKNG